MAPGSTPHNHPTHPAHDDPDWQKGAVEGDKPSDGRQQGNDNAPALDDQGLPADPIAIAEDRIGANEDNTQG